MGMYKVPYSTSICRHHHLQSMLVQSSSAQVLVSFYGFNSMGFILHSLLFKCHVPPDLFHGQLMINESVSDENMNFPSADEK